MDRRTLLAIAAFALLAVFAVWILAPERRPEPDRTNPRPLTHPADIAETAATPTPAPPSPSGRGAGLVQTIGNALEKLRGTNPERSREILDALRAQLLGEDRALAVQAIVAFLATGKDAPTGIAFEVGPGGALSGADTLRVFLLDLLGQMDPEAAFRAGLAVFAEKKSAEEWAVALRNAGWAGETRRPFVAQMSLEMLAYPPWQAAPSPGFLEAFDAAVHAEATGSIAIFGSWIADESEDDGGKLRASLVAMNRFATLHPLAVARHLNDNPDILADRPFIRADYFAKADFFDERQAREVERYLDRPDVSIEEKRKMLAALEAPVFMVGDSLLTEIPANPDLDRRELGVEARAKQWLASGRFPALEPEIRALTQFRMDP